MTIIPNQQEKLLSFVRYVASQNNFRKSPFENISDYMQIITMAENLLKELGEFE